MWHDEPATPGQLKVLKRHSLAFSPNITRGEAGKLIAEHDKPTADQVSALRSFGWEGNPDNLTQGKAGKLLASLANAPTQKQKEFLRNRHMKVPRTRAEACSIIEEVIYEPTEKQISYLRSLGHRGKVGSKQEADQLIKKLLAEHSSSSAESIAKAVLKRILNHDDTLPPEEDHAI